MDLENTTTTDYQRQVNNSSFSNRDEDDVNYSTSARLKLGLNTSSSSTNDHIIPSAAPPQAADSYVPMGDGTTCSQRSLLAEGVDLFWDLMDYMKNRSWKKKVLTVVMVGTTFVVFFDLVFTHKIVGGLYQYAQWMKLHVFMGTFLFIALMVVSTLAMVPPQVLTFLCGYVFAEVSGVGMGIAAATLASFVGLSIGAGIAFLRARYMMRDLVRLFAKRYRVVRAADRAIARHGFRVMLLLRLCPMIPFNGLNYIGGITDVTMEEFLFSLVGMLPLTILTVVAGATTGSLVTARQQGTGTYKDYTVYWVFLVLGVVFLIIAVVITVIYAKKELDLELALEEQEIESERRAQRRAARRPSPSNASTSSVHVEDRDPFGPDRPDAGPQGYKVGEDDEEWFWLFPAV